MNASFTVSRFGKLFLVLGLMFSLLSCKKDKKEETVAPTKAALLTSHTWKITAATAVPSGSSTSIDFYTTYVNSCYKDNIYTFKIDSTLIIDEGSTKCDPNHPQNISEKWYFNSDQTKITSFTPWGRQTSDIIELTESTFKTKTLVNASGTSFDVTTTYTKP